LNTATVQASIADRLSSTIFLAALAHGVVILGVTFTSTTLPDTDALPSLNVTLLLDTHDPVSPPQQPSELLANTNRIGGGRVEEDSRPTRTLSADHPITQAGDPLGADLQDGTLRDRAPVAEQLLTPSRAEDQARALPQATDDPSSKPMTAAALINNASARTSATEINTVAQLPQSNSDEELAGPTATESMLATYLVGWRERVERIGTANFPQRFLGQDESVGRPTLEVAIGAQGQLEDIVVRQSSGDTTLDQAALKILRLAAPFEPLPESIVAKYKVLRFAYEWDFSASGEN